MNRILQCSGVLAATCVLAIGIYAYTAPLGRLESLTSNPADEYYNLLVQGFREGHLSVNKEVPTGLARLADPYDPVANRLYRGLPDNLSDLSYYKGRLYLYFGVTPALILFWPFVALTGHYLFGRAAVTVFCAVGITVGLGLLRALWRRYFAEVSVGVVAACALALGLATGVPTLLPQSGVYQVSISCGYMLTMLALGGIWCAVHEPERGWRWLAVASAAYGLAVGARPNLLFGGIILLVPVVLAQCERRRVWTLLIAAIVPITLIGLGLMYYNFLRFEDPFEFGVRYELGGQRQVAMQFFSTRYLWFNFRVYFLEPARWKAWFPFVNGIVVPPVPKGHNGATDPFGILTNIPLAWLALAAPLAWRDRSPQTASILRWFVAAVGLVFGVCALTLGLVCGANLRYEVDFLPALVLLAVVGILGSERALAPTSESGLAVRPVWRHAVRWGWGVLLGFSIAFNVLVSVENYAHAGCSLGTMLARGGRVPEAIQVFENALRITPDDAEGHNNLGIALWQAGKGQEAIRECEYALQLNPDYADAHNSLGVILYQIGKRNEAIEHYQQALRIKPDYAEAHCYLGIALQRVGRLPEAREHYEQALRIEPDHAETHNNLGNVLLQEGEVGDAIGHYEHALRSKPDYAEAHYNLGLALSRLGRVEEAVGHWEQALRIKPDYAEVHCALGVALEQAGRVPEAIAHYEQALRIKPDYTEAHNNLGNVFLQEGKVSDAIGHYEQALRSKPDFAEAHHNLGLALARLGRLQEAVGHWEQAVRIRPDYAEPHYGLGIALEQVGNVPEAIAQYEQALRIKPDYTEAQTALARLHAHQ